MLVTVTISIFILFHSCRTAASAAALSDYRITAVKKSKNGSRQRVCDFFKYVEIIEVSSNLNR